MINGRPKEAMRWHGDNACSLGTAVELFMYSSSYKNRDHGLMMHHYAVLSSKNMVVSKAHE